MNRNRDRHRDRVKDRYVTSSVFTVEGTSTVPLTGILEIVFRDTVTGPEMNRNRDRHRDRVRDR